MTVRARLIPMVAMLLGGSAFSYTLIKDSSGNGRKWFANQMPVTYRINTGIDEPSIPGSEEFDEIRYGPPRWAAATNVLSINDVGSTSKVGTSYDQQNVVTMQDTTNELSGNTLAATIIYLNGTQTETVNGQRFKNMTDCDIIFADGVNFGTSAEVNAPGCVDDYSLRAVATHEFGHLLGLDHSTNGSATMFPSLGACNDSKATLAADDLAGITFIYPPGGGAPVADFIGNPTLGPAPLTVSFNDRSTNIPTSHNWSFGDGATAAIPNPTHSYAAQGSYTVSLTVSNAAGQDTETKIDYITVLPPPPVAGFVASPTRGAAPLAVAFTNQTTGVATSYAWDFGDGTSSTLSDPQHTYVAPGRYDVALTATGPGGSNTLIRPNYIEALEPPNADFMGVPTDGVLPLTVAFTNLTSGYASGFTWSFGDGGSSTMSDPGHAYTTLGSFDVSLLASGAAGPSTETKPGYITTHEVLPEFDAAPRIGQPPLSVQFQDLTVGTAVAYLWDFGDGQTSTAANPSHDYTAVGRYTVTLTVDGPSTVEIETKSDFVLVSVAPPQDIATGAGPDPTAAPRVLAYDALGSPNVATDIVAYGVLKYGANVGGGDIDGTPAGEILTGPGPGPVFGPQVRAFLPSSAPVAKVNFYAYGTLRYGVAATGVEMDADGADELLTLAGHGAVFGPHVRGFDYDGVALAPLAKVSFFAYATLRYGVNGSRGSLDGAAGEELLTMPGPGPTFGPQVRGYRVLGPLAPLQKINFFAFTSASHGGRVASSDADADGFDEILAGLGPGPALLSQLAGFDYDDSAVVPIPVLSLEAFSGATYGVEPQGGDIDGDTVGEILAAAGADPAGPARVRAFDYDGTVVTPIPSLDMTPYGSGYGLHVAVEELGF